MAGMGLELGLYQKLEEQLSQGQKLGLKMLLKLKLSHPDIPLATKGLEGILRAHDLLKERESVGVLIGSLAGDIWSQRRKPEDLEKHKDVDVLVLSDNFELEKNFEGGIDWWMPYEKRITIKGNLMSQDLNKKYWANGNGAILHFGSYEPRNFAPGLYILNPDKVAEMRLKAALASVETKFLDSDIEQKFLDREYKKMGFRLPKFMAENFKDYIMSSDYTQDGNIAYGISFEQLDLPTITALNETEKCEANEIIPAALSNKIYKPNLK